MDDKRKQGAVSDDKRNANDMGYMPNQDTGEKGGEASRSEDTPDMTDLDDDMADDSYTGDE